MSHIPSSTKKPPIPHLEASPNLVSDLDSRLHQASKPAVLEIQRAVRRFLMAWDMWNIDRHHDIRRLGHESNEGEHDARECRCLGANIAVRYRRWRCGGG